MTHPPAGHVRATLRAAMHATETQLVEAMRLYTQLEDLDRLVLVDDPARPGYRWPVSLLDEVCDLDGYATEHAARRAHPAATPYRCSTCGQWHNPRPKP